MPRIATKSILTGWREIAKFLGQSTSVAQRWAKEGMPVRRDGRRVKALEQELNLWLGREIAGEPVHIATESPDMSSELKRGVSFVRTHGKAPPGKNAAPRKNNTPRRK